MPADNLSNARVRQFAVTGNSRYNETRYNGFHVVTNAPTGTDPAP
jgi:hypothetical protein